MTDLTKITEPFGLLDKATKDEFYAADDVGADFEHYSGTAHGWQPKDVVGWYSRVVYRVKQEPVRVKLNYSYTSEHLYASLATIIIGRHVITCDPDGTDPTVTWEPSE